MSPWRTFPLLVVLVFGGCKANLLGPRDSAQAKLGANEQSVTTPSDSIQGIDNAISAHEGAIKRLLGERDAAKEAAKRSERAVIDRTVMFITLALIFGVGASTVLAIWWQSKSFAVLAVAAGVAIPIVRSTTLALDYPRVTACFVLAGAAVTLGVMLLKSDKIREAFADALSFGKTALGHLERVDPSAAEVVKVVEKNRQDARHTRALIKKSLKEVA